MVILQKEAIKRLYLPKEGFPTPLPLYEVVRHQIGG
jgi:hypothetical protein